jgi:hypothetical protein
VHRPGPGQVREAPVISAEAARPACRVAEDVAILAPDASNAALLAPPACVRSGRGEGREGARVHS